MRRRAPCALADAETSDTGTADAAAAHAMVASLAEWAEFVAAGREAFINGLVRLGFRLVEDRSDGATSNATLRSARITVSIVDGFPYTPPKVQANEPVPRSWHRESDGHLCLYAPHDHDGQPWLDPAAFLERVDEWFTKNEAGWPNDPPALDLEAYLNLPVDCRFILHPDLGDYLDSYVQMRTDRHLIHIVRSGHVPKKSRKGLLSGYVTDIGQVDTPPNGWDDLVASTPAPAKIRTAMQRDRLDALLLQYHRGAQTGVLAITFKPTTPGGAPHPHLAFSGATNDAAMRLRSGARANDLADKHVYLIGVGALGSHIADGLSRAGIGHLTVRDHDVYKPGNATRHLVTTIAAAGTFKATAVEAVLINRPYNRANVTSSTDQLASPVEAATLLLGDALIVDVTADDSVTCLLEEAATQLGRRFVTACVQNEGRTLRVDIVPPLEGAEPQPATVLQPSRAPEMFEAGCGVPISASAPHAVTEAAAVAIRHIIGLLTDHPVDPAGELRELP